MRIPAWMITDEMKLTEHYKMYAEVFGLDVPMTQSQPTESTQGMHRTTSAPRSPNPATEPAESSVPKRSIVIRFRLPSRQSARLTPPIPVPTAEKADEIILQDMIQHLAAEEIKKLVEESENVDDSSPPRHDDTTIPGTRVESGKEITTKEETGKIISKAILQVMGADPLLQQQDIAIWLGIQMKFEKLCTTQLLVDFLAIRKRDQDDPHDDAHPEGENSAKRQKTSEYEAYGIWEKGNSGPEKIVLSLHKFPVIVFNDDDIEERIPMG
ncbi:hypothetical protein Tco_1085000 [Tanacetum coccineum]